MTGISVIGFVLNAAEIYVLSYMVALSQTQVRFYLISLSIVAFIYSLHTQSLRGGSNYIFVHFCTCTFGKNLMAMYINVPFFSSIFNR